MDTIFSLASGSYRAGVAVIRVSGGDSLSTLEAIADIYNPLPRQAQLATLRENGKTLDQALAIYFKSPASFTGEDVVEYHVHGGRAVIDGVLAALGRQAGCRLALPGEFTKRAFENGKLDLTEAEAIADLIDAETEAQRDQALGQLGGDLARLYGGWAEELSSMLAHQEADIEFPDEDLPAGISETLIGRLKKLTFAIDDHLNDNRRGERLRDGIRIAIIGAPNAGKSSLLNALMRRDVAIVSEEAGTTRDIIEAHLNLGGYPVILIDTAGLRDTDNKIEFEGIRRAREAAAKADLKIALFDGTAEQDAETMSSIDENTMTVFTKSDLKKKPGLSISAATGEGIDDLLTALTARTEEIFKGRSGPSPTRARHRSALDETALSLERALQAKMPELAAEDMRLALRALGRVTGKVHVEDLLDKIFRDFCIGK
jgi:tRNA modification GTPase